MSDIPLPRIEKEHAGQLKTAVKKCCNYDKGLCLPLCADEDCPCIQLLSCSLICKWFRNAVLPAEPALERIAYQSKNVGRCVNCGKLYIRNSNRAKYCPECSQKIRLQKEAARKRSSRRKVRI